MTRTLALIPVLAILLIGGIADAGVKQRNEPQAVALPAKPVLVEVEDKCELTPADVAAVLMRHRASQRAAILSLRVGRGEICVVHVEGVER